MGVLYVLEGDTCDPVECNERGSHRVRSNRVHDSGSTGEALDDAGNVVAIDALALVIQDQWTLGASAEMLLDGSNGAWRQTVTLGLSSLAGGHKDVVSLLGRQARDISSRRL